MFRLKQADRYTNFKQKQLWDLLDKRRQQKIYENQSVCRGMNVLIIGAGPCGLRTAIELVMLGAHVVVVDSRDKFTRNNVLHLWKFVIEDLRNLGAKVVSINMCAKFCLENLFSKPKMANNLQSCLKIIKVKQT